jgi:nitrite reductase/ring-hydroxylating ferredoxin subunit
VFDDFANVWTMVALGRELSPNKPLPLVVAGERVLLFRDIAGAPAALIDRCPHRGVPLSLGRVERSEIQCPFHGWRFGVHVHGGGGRRRRTRPHGIVPLPPIVPPPEREKSPASDAPTLAFRRIYREKLLGGRA